jgi:dihydrofolate synthase / folylpolyglutamate synthase
MTPRRNPSAFDYLFGLELIGIKFGLDNIIAILDAIGHPERSFRSLHVAGTNGKGSVTAMAERALRAAGHKSARYTSPHLVRLNERFSVGGESIEDPALEAAIDDVRTAIEDLRHAGRLSAPPTFFEVTTAVAFELFRRAGVDVAVVEVGLGGRLDATNVLMPVATAITSIGFDHEQYLGSTLRQIAIEKAGIVKPGVPVVVGDVPGEALEAIEEVARDRGAEVVRAGRELPREYVGIELGLRGAHQVRNAAVAVRLLEAARAGGIALSHDAIAAGLANVSWPGRLDLRRFDDGRELLLDAAHNPDGAASLAAYVAEWTGAKPTLVFGAMRDKDVSGMLRALLPSVRALVVTRAANPRSADPASIADAARAIAPDLPILVEPDRRRALEVAWCESARVVVAGSIFLVGDVLSEVDGRP